MAVNVVYNPETKTWVRSGSADDTGKTIKTDTFGKTAEEVRFDRVRQARKKAETPEIISKVVMDGKETTLISSPAFAEKLKVAVEDESKRLDKQFQSQSKPTIPDYLRRKPETKRQTQTTIPQSFLPPKTPIRETKEVVDKSFIRPPPPALKQTFISESGRTPQFFETTPEQRKSQEKRFESYEYEFDKPIRAGLKEGAKNVAVSGAVAVPFIATAVAVPALAPVIAVGGAGLTVKYGYDILQEFKKGDFGTKQQARTAVEIGGLAVAGKKFNKFAERLQQRKIDLRSARNIEQITDKKIDWRTQQQRTTKVDSVVVDPAKNKVIYELKVQKPKGFEVKVTTPTKQRTEIQTQLKPKQVIETPKIKEVSQATKETPIQTFIREGKGQELVFQAQTPKGLKQIYREPKGSFLLVERTKTGVFETKPKLNEAQQLRNLFGIKSQRFDVRQYKINQFKETKQIPKEIENLPFFRGGLFTGKKAQLQATPLSRFDSPRTLFKPKLQFRPKLSNKLKTTLSQTRKITTKIKPFPTLIQLSKLNTGQFQTIKPKLTQRPQQRPRLAQKPVLRQIPKLRISQQPKQTQQPIITQRSIARKPSRRIIAPIRPKTRPTPTTLRFGRTIPQRPTPKINERIPVKRKSLDQQKAYEVYVRERNKWRKIEGNVPKNKAYNIGASYTDTNPTTKFKLVQKGKTTQADETQTFINYKFTKSNNVYNEKKKYQKDTIGERGKNEFF